MEWISVKYNNELPKMEYRNRSKDVLVSCFMKGDADLFPDDASWVQSAHLTKGTDARGQECFYWTNDEDIPIDAVTHWMPLPEPPNS